MRASNNKHNYGYDSYLEHPPLHLPVQNKLAEIAFYRGIELEKKTTGWEQIDERTLYQIAKDLMDDERTDSTRWSSFTLPEVVYHKLPASVSYALFRSTRRLDKETSEKNWWTPEHTKLVRQELNEIEAELLAYFNEEEKKREKGETAFSRFHNYPHGKHKLDDLKSFLSIFPDVYTDWVMESTYRAFCLFSAQQIAALLQEKEAFFSFLEKRKNGYPLLVYVILYHQREAVYFSGYQKCSKEQIVREKYEFIQDPIEILLYLQDQDWAKRELSAWVNNSKEASNHAAWVCLKHFLKEQHICSDLFNTAYRALSKNSYFWVLLRAATEKTDREKEETFNETSTINTFAFECLGQEIAQIDLLLDESFTNRIFQVFEIFEPVDRLFYPFVYKKAYERFLTANLYFFNTLDFTSLKENEEKRFPKLVEISIAMWIMGADGSLPAAAGAMYRKILIHENREVGGKKRHEPLSVMLTTILHELLSLSAEKWPFTDRGLLPFSEKHRLLLLAALAELATSKAQRILHHEKKHAYRRKESIFESAAERAIQLIPERSQRLDPRRRFDRLAAIFRMLYRERRGLEVSHQDRKMVNDILKQFL